MKELKKFVSKQKKSVYTLSFLSLMIGIVIVVQAFFIVSIVEQIFIEEKGLSEVIPLLAVLLLAMLARSIFAYLSGRIGINLGSRVKREMRGKLIQQYKKNPIRALLKGQSGNRVSIIMETVDELEPYFSKYYPQMIQGSIVPLVILLALFWGNWISGLILVVIAPLIPFVMILIGRVTKEKARLQLEKLARFSGTFLDRLQGIVTLKLFGKSNEQHRSIRKSSLEYRDATMEVLKTAFLSSLLLELISMLGIALVAFEVGIRLVIYKDINFFISFFVLILAAEFFTILKDLGSAFHAGRGSIGAAKLVLEELENHESSIQWGDFNLFVKHEPPKIEIKNLSFSYGEGCFSLQKLNATIESNSEIAIVGRSGSGKTTLLHLLAGLYRANEGDIFINGKPLFDYKEKDWYNQLIYISQDPYLFSGTIKDNIMLGCSQDGIPTSEEVEKVIEKVGLSELVQELKDGFETDIGEGGRGLSGGEKQRVALARAFIKNPSIILFDEPTMGLDLKTEQILEKSIRELSENATIITVAHRLHTIKRADQIFFMAQGKLIVQGTHRELMSSASEYRTMFESQSGGAVG